MRAKAVPTPPAPTRRIRMRKILAKGPRDYWTGHDLGARLRKPLRMGQLCARTVRSAQPLATRGRAPRLRDHEPRWTMIASIVWQEEVGWRAHGRCRAGRPASRAAG